MNALQICLEYHSNLFIHQVPVRCLYVIISSIENQGSQQMNGYDYIQTKQINWALNKGIQLVGSKGERGRPAYTPTIDRNLFEPLDPEVRECFKKGDGGELNGTIDSPAKMQAVHSSAALAVNVFQYWQLIHQVPIIAAVCGLCRKGNNISKEVVFEEKFPIVENRSRIAPNIDVVIHNSTASKIKLFAIECKFSEPYSIHGDRGLKPEYLKTEDIWDDIPNLHRLSKSLCPEDNTSLFLHPAQLVKHILGLKRALGKDGFRLLYLWYDVTGMEGAIHRKEIEAFSEVAKADNIKFHSLSYQELISRLSDECRADHPGYIEYISSRYL